MVWRISDCSDALCPFLPFFSSQKHPRDPPAQHLCALSTVVALSSCSVFSYHRIKSETCILLCCSCSHSICNWFCNNYMYWKAKQRSCVTDRMSRIRSALCFSSFTTIKSRTCLHINFLPFEIWNQHGMDFTHSHATAFFPVTQDKGQLFTQNAGVSRLCWKNLPFLLGARDESELLSSNVERIL